MSIKPATAVMERAYYVQRVNPKDLVVSMERNGRRFVPKASDTRVQELVAALLREGRQLSPCGVSKTKEGGLRLEYGYRRWLALQVINDSGMVEDDHPLSKLEVVVLGGGRPIDDKAAFLTNITENAARDELTPIDKAVDAKTMRDLYGMSNKEIADYLRCKDNTVSRLIKMTELPMDVQRLLDSGVVAPNTAYEMADMDAEELAGVVADIKEGQKVSREAVRQAKSDKRVEREAQEQEQEAGAEGKAGGEETSRAAPARPAAKKEKKPKTGPKPGPQARGGKTIRAELEEYSMPEEGEKVRKHHELIQAIIAYATGKRTASWLVRQVEEAVG